MENMRPFPGRFTYINIGIFHGNVSLPEGISWYSHQNRLLQPWPILAPGEVWEGGIRSRVPASGMAYPLVY